MPRRGKCRCGTILVFERTARGYKVRCPTCQAVVRLRSDAPPPPPAAATATPATDFETPELIEEFDTLEALQHHPSSAPVAVVEMEVYQEPPSARRGPWLVAALAAFGLFISGAIALVLNYLL